MLQASATVDFNATAVIYKKQSQIQIFYKIYRNFIG